MKIAIIGTVMHDQITTVEGTTFESFGGILYNVLALSAVTGPEHTLCPVAYLSAEHIEEVGRTLLAGIDNLDLSHLRHSPTGTDTNVLRYVTTSSRREKMTVVTPAFSVEDFAGIEDADAAVINFISGHELDLATFKALRERTKGLIYLDAHNLGKLRRDGVPVKGHVFNDWPEWMCHVDVIQANEWEAERFFGAHPKTEDDFRDAAMKFLSIDGPRVAAMTLGPHGVALAWRDSPTSRDLQYIRIPAMPDEQIVDTTGCGDSFSAGFLVEYLRSGSPLRAAVLGSTLSGLKTRYAGLAGMRQITGVADAMSKHYGALLEQAATR